MAIRAEKSEEFVSLRQLKIIVFLGLVIVGLAATSALKTWGHTWSLALYRPVLVRIFNTQIGAGQIGAAEDVMLTAVHNSPEYATVALDASAEYLSVMPELSDQIERTFTKAYDDYARGEFQGNNLAKIRFARAEYKTVIESDRPVPAGIITLALWDYLNSASRVRLGLVSCYTVRPGSSAIKLGTDALPPSLRVELEPYFSLWKSVQQNKTEMKAYLSAVAALEFGDMKRAGDANVLANIHGPARADALFRTGQMHEAKGDREKAIARYAEAMIASSEHSDAAAAYLRLTANDSIGGS